MDYIPHISAFILIFLIAGFYWAARRLLDEIFPPTPEEIAQREAERIAKQASKGYKRRKRMRSGFWNVFN